MQTDIDVFGEAERGKIDHGNGAGGRGASRIVDDDRSAVRVSLEVRLVSNSSALVGDVGGGTVWRDHDAVGDVTHADLRTLLRVRLRQVDAGQRVVVVQHGVSSTAIGRDRDAHGIGSISTI